MFPKVTVVISLNFQVTVSVVSSKQFLKKGFQVWGFIKTQQVKLRDYLNWIKYKGCHSNRWSESNSIMEVANLSVTWSLIKEHFFRATDQWRTCDRWELAPQLTS